MTRSQARWQPGTTAGARPAAIARAPAARPDSANGSMPRPRPAAPAEMHPDTSADETQLPDLALYERLISDGIAAADSRDSAVDHVTPPTPRPDPARPSPPRARPSACPPGRNHRSSPTAWSASSAPEPSPTHSRP